MKVGIVGPLEVVEKIIAVAEREFPQMAPVPYVYGEYTEAPGLLQHQQNRLDAVLFAGLTAMSYTEKFIPPTVPWEAIPRNGSALLRVLLQIAMLNQYSLLQISSDIYDLQQLTETYEEVGIDKERFQIHTVTKTPLEDNYVDYVCAFHEQHYLCKQVSCCITAFYSVHKRLTAKGIPCFRIDPTVSVIRQTLHKLLLNHLVEYNQQSQIVALSIRIDSPDQYSILHDNEYQFIIDKTNVARQVYLFAQRIQGAVVEIGMREFLLFSTKHLIESVTNHFEEIDLLQAVKKNTSSSISLGVGYGQTAQEAKFNATLGMERASKLGGHSAFVVYDGNRILGPLRTNDDVRKESSEPKIDKKFLSISEKTGISINTIFQLHSLVEQQGRTRFTAAELAELAGVTARTMNRILVKLTAHGFCLEVGKRVVHNAGRPSRIMELSI